MKIALLGNFTLDLLAQRLSERGHEVWCAPGFDGWREIAAEVPRSLADFVPDTVAILLDEHFPAERPFTRDETAAAVAALAARFPDAAVFAPEIAALAADVGEDAFYDQRLWLLARMPYSLAGLDALCGFFGYHKAVAVDLDDTLWSGVIAEDGVDAIAPAIGFQRELLALQARGVLLVALSKNNFADVAPVWSDPRMLLKADDFAALAIDWNSKSENLRRLAAELNLGLDAFVFVDDSPANRAEMRANCPSVATAAFPPRLADYFPPRALTAEDRGKTAAYRADAERREFGRGKTAAEYLRGLQIVTNVREMSAAEVPRVAQLSQKTNQFNVRCHRLTAAEVSRFLDDSGAAVFVAESRDRFGDQGLIAFVRVTIAGERAEIVDWAMSCRAMNRRIEFAIEAEIERALASRGVSELAASWERNARNSPVENLFDHFDFTLIDASANRRRYVKSLKFDV